MTTKTPTHTELVIASANQEIARLNEPLPAIQDVRIQCGCVVAEYPDSGCRTWLIEDPQASLLDTLEMHRYQTAAKLALVHRQLRAVQAAIEHVKTLRHADKFGN